LYPRLGVFLVPLAFSVGISRVVLIAHYPSDVLFGAYLGMATAILVKRHYFDRRNIF
jgi:undecaprenyl-diphosphatase